MGAVTIGNGVRFPLKVMLQSLIAMAALLLAAAAGAQTNSIELHSVEIVGDEVTVVYSKDSTICATMFADGQPAQTALDLFCDNGSNISTTLPLMANFDEVFDFGANAELRLGSIAASDTVEITGVPSIMLHAVVLDGPDVRVTYTKNFVNCSNLVLVADAGDVELNIANMLFCGRADNETYVSDYISEYTSQLVPGVDVYLRDEIDLSRFSNTVTVLGDNTLISVEIQGDDVIVEYDKEYDTCTTLFIGSHFGPLASDVEFCDAGPQTVVVPLADFNAGFEAGIDVVLGISEFLPWGTSNAVTVTEQDVEEPAGSCVLVDGPLTLGDRALLSSGSTIHADGFVSLSSDSVVDGSLQSLGNASFLDRATVTGDYALGGSISPMNGSVDGTLTQGASVDNLSFEGAHSVPTSGNNVTVYWDGTRTITPGTYGRVRVFDRGTLRLNGAGTYNFSELALSNDAKLEMDTSQGEFSIEVQGNVQFGHRSKVQGIGGASADPNNITIYTNDTFVGVGHNSDVNASLLVPQGTIWVYSGSYVNGCVAASALQLENDSIVEGLDEAPGGGGTEPPPPPPPGDTFSGQFVVSTDWGTGYCVTLLLTNDASVATNTWTASIDTHGTTIYTSWNGNFTGSNGNISVTPVSWNASIGANSTNDSIGFCANRPGFGTSVATVTNATATYP